MDTVWTGHSSSLDCTAPFLYNVLTKQTISEYRSNYAVQVLEVIERELGRSEGIPSQYTLSSKPVKVKTLSDCIYTSENFGNYLKASLSVCMTLLDKHCSGGQVFVCP